MIVLSVRRKAKRKVGGTEGGVPPPQPLTFFQLAGLRLPACLINR